jgi:RNA polymerase sigma-B factor
VSSTERRPTGVERERLIESNLALARSIARRHSGRGAELDDLVQVASVGLIKAADRFDPARGASFSTFATQTIEGEIRHHLRDQTSSLRIPRELQRMSGQLRRQEGELGAALGRSPTTSELAAAVEADQREVESALVADRAREAVAISPEYDSASPPSSNEGLTESDTRLLLAGSVRSLDERERRIVYLRFHADMTERQIAREIGISQAHVSRLLAGSLAKLRAELASSSDQGRDTAENHVVSPKTESQVVPDPGRPRPTGVQETPGRGNKLRSVGASQAVPRSVELAYNVKVSRESDGWVATAEGLPDCSASGATPEHAVQRLRPVLESWLNSAIAESRGAAAGDVSKQKSTSRYSGRFLVRMPGELHEQLARAAERNHVSLNRFVTEALAGAVGRRPLANGSEQAPAEAAEPGRAPTPVRSVRIALAANLVVVVFVALVAIALLVLAIDRGI